VNYLNAAGLRVKLRPIERAAYFKGFAEKKYRGSSTARAAPSATAPSLPLVTGDGAQITGAGARGVASHCAGSCP
jgi:hypothetical protein